VIIEKCINLLKERIQDKEIQIYHSLILSLALADFLMGVYLTAISLEMRYKASIDIYQTKPRFCNFLGVISTVSSQVSLTNLFIISYYRLTSILQPYKKQHLRIVRTLIILSWIVWLTVAVIPFIPFEPFKTGFRIGFMKEHMLDRDSLIDFTHFVSIIQTKILPSYNNVSEVATILEAVTQFPTSSVMEKFSSATGWVNLDSENWNPVRYYDFHYMCVVDFVVMNEDYRRFPNSFSLVFVISNLILSVAILIFYILITIKLYKTTCLNFIYCKVCLLCFSCEETLNNNVEIQPSNTIRSAENRKLLKRISFIVMTDLMCWIPLCITSLVIWHFPPSLIQNKTNITLHFHTALLVLITVNSIWNPYIYSYKFWNKLFIKCKRNNCVIGNTNQSESN